MTLPTAQAVAGLVEREGNRIKRRPHAEVAACSKGRSSDGLACHRWPHAEATACNRGCEVAALHASGWCAHRPALAATQAAAARWQPRAGVRTDDNGGRRED
ncbi:hypothetical protein GW17_00016697 [Ensete ventricosum]|nr:hypothetical protein GW17_00016697 [Ensete ventricosum]